jgi:hypothetical protein
MVNSAFFLIDSELNIKKKLGKSLTTSEEQTAKNEA